MTEASKKPVIFLAFANDRDDTVGYLRNLPDEARRLRDVLQPAQQAGLCEVEIRSNTTAEDIFKVFQDPDFRNRIAIFHYGGHANGYQLLLESSAGQSAAADAGGLAAFLAQQQGLQLVFLNGCSTQQQTEGLLNANVSAVISTSCAIDDRVATDFSYHFYQGLAGGASIRTAYNEAEASVQLSKGRDTRKLYFGDANESQVQLEADRWPWNLYLREGSEHADQWNLPEAVDDPLFGLPPLPQQDLPETPYRHLNWFTRKDAEVFFGRGHQIRELYERVTNPQAAPIVLFYGQSGVGKSSILDAGLFPRLDRENAVRYLRRDRQLGLAESLRRELLAADTQAPIAGAWRASEQRLGKPLIIVLDQVEELYTRPNPDLPDELSQLLEIVSVTFANREERPRGKLVMGFRKEWLAEFKRLIELQLPRSKVFLEPLDERGIIEVVEGPVRSKRLRNQFGLTIENGLAETVAGDLLEDRDSAIAPTLQILLTKMWSCAKEADAQKPQFNDDQYVQLKKDGILLRDFLEQQVAACETQSPAEVKSGLLLDIIALHTTSLGTADQRTRHELQQQYAHVADSLSNLLRQCEDLYLLTEADDAAQENLKTTRLAHDTLAPLIREKFEHSDKPGQRARRILDNRSVDWREGREGAPLDEADLTLVEQAAAGTRVLIDAEQRLMEASLAERAGRERERAAQQHRRRVFNLLGALAVIAIVIAAGFGWQQQRVANTALRETKKERERLQAFNDYLWMSELGGQIATADTPDEAHKLYSELNIGTEFRSFEQRDLASSHLEIREKITLLGKVLKEYKDNEPLWQFPSNEDIPQAILGVSTSLKNAWKSIDQKDVEFVKLAESRRRSLFNQAVSVTKRLADPEQTGKRAESDMKLFWALYYSELVFVEGTKVANAMFSFGEELNQPQSNGDSTILAELAKNVEDATKSELRIPLTGGSKASTEGDR